MEFQAIEQLDNGQTDILYSLSGIELGVLEEEVVCLSQRSKIQMLDIFLKIYSLSVNIIQHTPKYLLIRGSVEGKNDIIQE